MKTVFMGTPEFAVPSLDILHRSEFEVAAVVTAPDRPAGRGRKLHASAVKKFALANNIPVLQPVKLKDEDFITSLKELNADIFVVVAFRMLPVEVWSMPKRGTINLHASLLPNYRGAAPINWAIINGERTTGLTTFYINEKIDTGSLLLQKQVDIGDDTSAGELHDQLMELGADLILETLKSIEKENIKPKEQDLRGNYPSAPKLNRENTNIDFNKTAKEVKNLIRGLSPYPGAYSILLQKDEKLQVKIFSCEIESFQKVLAPGGVVTDNSTYLNIGCADSNISVRELQMEGKRRMNIRELLNGYNFSKDAKFV